MRYLVVLLLIVLTFTHSARAETAYDRVMRTGTLRCGFVPWPPGFEIDPNTQAVHGPTKDLFEGIIRLTGWKVAFVEVPLGNVALDLNNGRIDAMCGDGPWTLTSIRLVDYTTWAAYTPIFIYVRAGTPHPSGTTALDREGTTLVGIDGDVSTDLATLRFPKASLRTLASISDPSQLLMDVATGKADATILDPVTAEKFMQNNPNQIEPLDPATPIAVYPIGMSVKRGEASLQQTLSRATEMAINIGLVDTLLDRYDPERRIIYAPLRMYDGSHPGVKP